MKLRFHLCPRLLFLPPWTLLAQTGDRCTASSHRTASSHSIVAYSVDHGSARFVISFHTVFRRPRILSAFHRPLHSGTPLPSHTVAFSLLLLSHSILACRCSCIWPNFYCFCSLSAFSHAAVHAYDRIFAASAQHSRPPRFSRTVTFSLLLLSAFSPAAVYAHGHIFAAFALSQHSHTLLFSRTYDRIFAAFPLSPHTTLSYGRILADLAL